MRPRTLLLAGVLSGAGLAGCTEGLDAPAYTTQVIEAAEPDDVLRAAEIVLRREFRYLTVDRQRRQIVSEPREYSALTGSGTARDLVGAPSRLRRTAEFAVFRRGADTLARIRIDVEREDTAQRTNTTSEGYRISDSPGYTPIERQAATTEQQNTVWTRVRRDRQLERALLNEVRERFAPEVPEEGAGQAAGGQSIAAR